MRSVGASGRHCIVYAISGHGCSPLRCRGTPPYGASRKFERYSPECVEKLSEKSRRHPKLGLRRHPKGTVRPVLVPEQRPNPRSEHCSYPFSDSFLTEFSEVSVASANTCELPESRRADCQRASLGRVGFCDGRQVHTTPLPYGAERRCHLSRLYEHGGPRTARAHPEAYVLAHPE